MNTLDNRTKERLKRNIEYLKERIQNQKLYLKFLYTLLNKKKPIKKR